MVAERIAVQLRKSPMADQLFLAPLLLPVLRLLKLEQQSCRW
jgi:hypothetical protein